MSEPRDRGTPAVCGTRQGSSVLTIRVEKGYIRTHTYVYTSIADLPPTSSTISIHLGTRTD